MFSLCNLQAPPGRRGCQASMAQTVLLDRKGRPAPTAETALLGRRGRPVQTAQTALLGRAVSHSDKLLRANIAG